MHHIGQTGKATDWKEWFEFEVTDVRKEFWDDYFIVMKITGWEEKWKYNIIMNYELDETIIFNK